MEIQEINDLSTGFLARLKDIPQAPHKLYIRGQLPSHNLPSVAIVGSRKNTSYGATIAYSLARDLARQGIVVVSGLAYGIDSEAHKGCLDAGGLTIAVLGSGIDHIYPSSHTALANKILKKGAVISEYAATSKTHNWQFLERNRLVSGLADILVVVEAACRSGTLATAAFALDQGKTVYAVPGDITRPSSVGCNRLIRQGATPLIDSYDLIRQLIPNFQTKSQKSVRGDSPNENIVLKRLSAGFTDAEGILNGTTGLSVAELNQALSLLEIKGLIRPLGANHWAIA